VYSHKISENGCFKHEFDISFQSRITTLLIFVPNQWKSASDETEGHKFYNPEGFILFYKPDLGAWIINTSSGSQGKQLIIFNADQMGGGAAAEEAQADEECSGLLDVNRDGELNDTPESVLNEVNNQFNQCNSQPPPPAVPGAGTEPATPAEQSPQGWSSGLSSPNCPTPPTTEDEGHSIISWVWAGIKAIGSGVCSLFDGNRSNRSGRGDVRSMGVGHTGYP